MRNDPAVHEPYSAAKPHDNAVISSSHLQPVPRAGDPEAPVRQPAIRPVQRSPVRGGRRSFAFHVRDIPMSTGRSRCRLWAIPSLAAAQREGCHCSGRDRAAARQCSWMSPRAGRAARISSRLPAVGCREYRAPAIEARGAALRCWGGRRRRAVPEAAISFLTADESRWGGRRDRALPTFTVQTGLRVRADGAQHQQHPARHRRPRAMRHALFHWGGNMGASGDTRRPPVRSLTGGRALQRCPFLEGGGHREPRRRTVFRRVRSLVEERALDAVSGRG
jgi:hypothetical protein